MYRTVIGASNNTRAILRQWGKRCLKHSISIIICTRNRAGSLEQTLASMQNVSVPAALDCELIVADNGSEDHTERVAENAKLPGMHVKYLYEGEKGQSCTRNTAIGQAHGDI